MKVKLVLLKVCSEAKLKTVSSTFWPLSMTVSCVNLPFEFVKMYLEQFRVCKFVLFPLTRDHWRFCFRFLILNTAPWIKYSQSINYQSWLCSRNLDIWENKKLHTRTTLNMTMSENTCFHEMIRNLTQGVQVSGKRIKCWSATDIFLDFFLSW